jgi:hypothetical protein
MVPADANPTLEDPCNPGFGSIFGHWAAETGIIFLVGNLLALLTFSFIEKPGIDARIVFKNRYAVKK